MVLDSEGLAASEESISMSVVWRSPKTQVQAKSLIVGKRLIVDDSLQILPNTQQNHPARQS